MTTITVDMVMSWRPCWSEPAVRSVVGDDLPVTSDTVHQVRARGVSDDDIVWAACRALDAATRATWLDRIVERAVRDHALYCGVPAVEEWASRWLDGTDRTAESARAAARAARAARAAWAAPAARAAAAAWATAAATRAAEAARAAAALAADAATRAAEAARAAAAAWATAAAALAADAATRAAEAAAAESWAAERAAQVDDLRAVCQ